MKGRNSNEPSGSEKRDVQSLTKRDGGDGHWGLFDLAWPPGGRRGPVDTGPGIAPEVLPEIFTPCHTTKAEGMGLGLYVVQAIIAAHDGRIVVESELGQGATLSITLPQIMPTSPA